MALLDRAGQASMRRLSGTFAQIVYGVVRRVEPGGRSRTSIASQVCDVLRRLIYGRPVAKRPRHQCTGDEGGKASNDRASRVLFLDDAGMICSAVVVRRPNLSRSHAGLRGTGTQGPARGATIQRSTVHCQSKPKYG